MGYMVLYDESPVDGLNLYRGSQSWSTGELDSLEREFEEKAVGFEITAPDGSIVVTGRYHGEARHRDFPLESVRNQTSHLDVEPVRLVYEDGTTYRFDPEIGFAVPETKK